MIYYSNVIKFAVSSSSHRYILLSVLLYINCVQFIRQEKQSTSVQWQHFVIITSIENVIHFIQSKTLQLYLRNSHGIAIIFIADQTITEISIALTTAFICSRFAEFALRTHNNRPPSRARKSRDIKTERDSGTRYGSRAHCQLRFQQNWKIAGSLPMPRPATSLSRLIILNPRNRTSGISQWARNTAGDEPQSFARTANARVERTPTVLHLN